MGYIDEPGTIDFHKPIFVNDLFVTTQQASTVNN